MIKADELREFRPVVRYRDGSAITLRTVQDAIKDCAQGMGIPVAFYNDQVKSGGLFNKTIEDCIVLYHPEHQKNEICYYDALPQNCFKCSLLPVCFGGCPYRRVMDKTGISCEYKLTQLKNSIETYLHCMNS